MATGRTSTHETQVPDLRGNPMADAQARPDGPHDKGKPPPSHPVPASSSPQDGYSAEELLRGNVKAGDTVHVSAAEGKLVFKAAEPHAAASAS